jgi:hypothetical protein
MKRAARCSASLHTPSRSTFRTFRNVPARNRRVKSRLDFAVEKEGAEISLACPLMCARKRWRLGPQIPRLSRITEQKLDSRIHTLPLWAGNDKVTIARRDSLGLRG